LKLALIPTSFDWQNNPGVRAAESACINKNATGGTKQKSSDQVRCNMAAAGGSRTLVVLEDEIHLLNRRT